MLPNEPVFESGTESCPDCKIVLRLEVLFSAAGFYIGTRCECGPYSRESGYYFTETDAALALSSGQFGRRPDLPVPATRATYH